jgi:colanic acid/amylovoran biosynthesis glycosyltransferase
LDVFRRFYLDAELVNLKPEIVNFEFGALAVERTHIGQLLGTKIIVSFRGYDLYKAGMQDPNFYDKIWENADALHLLGLDLWKRAQLRGCPEAKMHKLIPPAIDPGVFGKVEKHHTKKVGTQERPMRILSVGRLEWEKGYQFALQAIRILRDKGLRCEYHIIGIGKELEAITLAIDQLQLNDCTVLLQAQPPSKVLAEMEWADVLLHPAVCEAFCNVVIEAQAALLPVVCTDAGGLPENVQNGVTGYLVPRRDAGALAEKLMLLASDPDLRQRIGEAGRKRALQSFILKDQISAFISLYGEVLGRNPDREFEMLQNTSVPAHHI